MPAPRFKNRVGMTVSGAPGTGTITLGSAILDATNGDYVSFSAAYAADANVDVLYIDGHNTSIERDVTYNHAGGTLIRGTVEATWNGSTLSTSALSLTSAARVFVSMTAGHAMQQIANIDSIDGLLCTQSALTTAQIGAGHVWIEGVRYDQASATTLSLSSGNEIGGGSIAADRLLYIYAYSNAGSLAYKWDLRNSTGDDPVWSEEFQYWHHQSIGTGYRLVGVLRTKFALAELDSPNCRNISKRGRALINRTFNQILSVTGTTGGSVALAPYVPVNGTAFIGFMGAGDVSDPGIVQANFSIQPIDIAASACQIIAKGYAAAANSTMLFGQNTIKCRSTDSIYASGSVSSNYARVFFVGFEYEV